MAYTFKNRTRNGRRGFLLLVAAGMMFVLLAFVGLAFDVGFLQWSRRRAQTAADAAAMAGAWAYQMSGSVVTEGKASSALNGFTDASENTTVTINNPPATGTYTSDATAVEAIVSRDAPSYFIRVLGYNILPVRARAVARRGYGTGCVYALNPTIKSGLKFSGNSNFGDVNLGCGAIVASNNTEATTVVGGKIVNLTSGASIGSVGGYKVQPGATVNPSYGISSGDVFPGDPLITLAMPTYTSEGNPQCFDGTAMVAGPCIDNNSGTIPPLGTYQPGVYCGGININSGPVTFAAGRYFLVAGNGLQFGSSTIATGSDVTFYITDTSDGWPCTINGNTHPGDVTVQAGADVHLSASTCGAYAGVLLFGNRAVTTQPSNVNLNAGVFNGAIYFPKSNVSFAATGDSSGYQMIVGDTIDFTGGFTLSLNKYPDCSGSGNSDLVFKKWVVMAE